jgi:hypothetical protein
MVPAADPANPAANTAPIAGAEVPRRDKKTPSTTPISPIPNERSHAEM